MSTLTEYMEKQDTHILEFLLQGYCDGSDDMYYEVALTICRILANRKENKPPVEESLRKMCALYLP